MYRTRTHFTVSDLEGWNEIVAIAAEVNQLSESRGFPTGTLWTETVGPFNHLVFEVDYDSLATYESVTKEMYGMSEFATLAQRMSTVTIDNGHLEMFERADAVGGD
jgi:hypothetical protein